MKSSQNYAHKLQVAGGAVGVAALRRISCKWQGKKYK